MYKKYFPGEQLGLRTWWSGTVFAVGSGSETNRTIMIIIITFINYTLATRKSGAANYLVK
jgi:hypothetical protein